VVVWVETEGTAHATDAAVVTEVAVAAAAEGTDPTPAAIWRHGSMKSGSCGLVV